MVEALAKEWPFNDAPVPWILPASYHNPNETVPDFDDNEAGSLGKEPGPAPSTGASAEVMAADGAEDDDGFETVDDRDEEPGDKVVITISAKEVANWVENPQCLNLRRRMIPKLRNGLRLL